MKREERLRTARSWLAGYKGTRIVRSYRKRYGVDWLCAVKELQLLGVEIDPEYIAQLETTVAEQAKKTREKRRRRQEAAEEREWWNRYPFSEGEFYFVAGYTSGGAPYGITWEEAREKGLIEQHEPFGSPGSDE